MAEILNDPLYMWRAYCDKKMELEEAEDRIEQLEQTLHAIRNVFCSACNGDIDYQMALEEIDELVDTALTKGLDQ